MAFRSTYDFAEVNHEPFTCADVISEQRGNDQNKRTHPLQPGSSAAPATATCPEALAAAIAAVMGPLMPKNPALSAPQDMCRTERTELYALAASKEAAVRQEGVIAAAAQNKFMLDLLKQVQEGDKALTTAAGQTALGCTRGRSRSRPRRSRSRTRRRSRCRSRSRRSDRRRKSRSRDWDQDQRRPRPVGQWEWVDQHWKWVE